MERVGVEGECVELQETTGQPKAEGNDDDILHVSDGFVVDIFGLYTLTLPPTSIIITFGNILRSKKRTACSFVSRGR
jgi:hypothetical protein